MSTAAAFAFAFGLAGCAGGGSGTTTGGDRILVADPAMITIRPGGTGSARFLLTSGGVPIAGQHVSLSIVDSGGATGGDAKGATLADTGADTDVSGVAAVGVHAGAATTFKIRATAGATQAMPLVVVVALATGSIEIEPFLADDLDPTPQPPRLDVWLFENQACAEIPQAHPEGGSGIMMLPRPAADSVRFDLVSTALPHAVVGRALSGDGTTIAVGCVDIPPTSLVADSVVKVWLPLREAIPDPVGSFSLSSTLLFQPPLPAAAAIAAPWRDLADCPLDPAQLLLDCIEDALGPASADDPLDCKPNPAPGGEGALGDVFASRRGLPIGDGDGAPTACRAAIDASGAPSLDAIALGLFGVPTPPLLIALSAIAGDAAHVLDSVQLASTLTVARADAPDQYVITHTLVSAGFGSSASVSVPLLPLALPALTAYTGGETRDGLLVIDDHGFTLRLGRVARAGFAGTALVPRGVPSDRGAIVAAIAKLAKSDDGATSGCAAFDGALCAKVGSAPGCLATACPAGLGALAERLESAFDAADGTGLDFFLSGSAPLIGTPNDSSAHQLGAPTTNQTKIAVWSVDLRTAAGRTRMTTSFTGVRNP